METRHDDSDGSNIFWPGYVDATTNLVLNLLFLLTIMIVAVFMFALELGRAGGVGLDQPVDTTKLEANAASGLTTDPAQENIVLKREIQRLKKLLAQGEYQKGQSGGALKTVDATSKEAEPLSGLDKTQVNGSEIIVLFRDEAVAFTLEESNRLVESLKTVEKTGRIIIYVEVPAGFSEAKRMGFYRAMAVRNLLLEMDIPKENIEVLVVDGKRGANASLVKIRSR